ncbi:MAG TPA: ribonuclease HII [Candidatus Dormibacteraeota bacterium]|nr:ribonuclease HII [Candidatus Dormibacteraeota bacterium]
MERNSAAQRERCYELGARERELREHGYYLIAGIDEAGRGPLAGPVVAACTILREALLLPGVDDSKRLSPARRAALVPQIHAAAAAWGIGLASAQEIDTLNIYRATQLAMRRALAAAELNPDFILTDAMPLGGLPMPVEAIVRGDARCTAIAAASILAKEYRDELLVQFDAVEPKYGFRRHKGYPTAEHLAALRLHGPCSEHRRSFAPVARALAIHR